MADQKTYMVVLRAQSTARFKPEEGSEVVVSVPGSAGSVRTRLRTRWINESYDAPIPRELWIEALGPAQSLDEAVTNRATISRFLTTILSFSANTPVGIPEVHLAYDASPGSTEREFLQVFVPDERGHPSEGRMARTDEFIQVYERLSGSSESARVHRAIQQYGIALRYWYLGGEWLALTHLYMAVETLTKAVIRRCCEDDSLEEEEFAKRKGIDTTDPTRWRHLLQVWCRETVIFEGDQATYTAARRASDGVEHGFLELSEVYTSALVAAEATFGYVRRTVLRLLKVPPSEFADLYQRSPRDVSSMRKLVRGRFLGDGSDPAPSGEEYPLLEWHSSVQNIKRDGDSFTASFQERFTVRCNPQYVYRGEAFEVRGRKEEGREPVRIDAESVVTVTAEAGPPATPPSAEALQLMRRAHTLADEAARHGNTVQVSTSMSYVFELFSVQVSLFEAIDVLLRDNRPVEAIALLRSLILGACRLQSIGEHSDPGGAALRTRLDSVERLATIYSSDADAMQRIRDESIRWQAAAGEMGVVVPEASPELSNTELYAAHGDSLRFAEEVALADTLAAALHGVKSNPDRRQLYTRVANAELIRDVAGSAVAALIASTAALCKTLNWPCDESQVETIRDEAERMVESR